MDERIPYLAGFLDGEGSIAVGISKNPKGERRWYLRFSAHQTNPAPLFILKEVFGGSIRENKHEDKKNIYEWVTQSMSAYEALLKLRPYLVVKAEEADVAIEFQRLLLARGTRRTALTAEEQEARETLYRRLRELKAVSFEDEIPAKVHRPPKPRPPKKIRVKTAVPIRSSGYDRSKKPDAMMLGDLYGECGLNATARYFGVSRQTIYNWLDGYGIGRTGRTHESEARRIAGLKDVWKTQA